LWRYRISKKNDKEYHIPTKIGKKWQTDVKYVPKECRAEEIQTNNKLCL